jgi:antitoxin VapB
MSLSIKNAETEQLARRVADKTGESLTGAIQKSLEERLARLQASRRNRLRADQIAELLRRVDALPTRDTRPAEEILGYDEHGMPR